ncbi:O-methyltransferase [Actinopolymorpha alba]|uniref:O-methyltransferase n=1 Tax=Actinopolymorpha alba TaxID=533267 RepID=UPI000687E3A3|nr:class I SAM-dependent methyltransferase [Actinopolymorpha alba]
MTKPTTGLARVPAWIIPALVAGWTVATAVFAWRTQTPLGTTVVLLAMGPLLAGLLAAHRKQVAVLRRLDHQSRTIAAAARELHEVRGRLDSLATRALSTEQFGKAMGETATNVINRTRKGVAADLLMTYRQLEALHNLYAIAPVERPLPQTRGWASSPDLLLFLADLVARTQPSLIVECGSGTSTVWLAMLLRQFEIKGRVVALEHQAAYVDKAKAMLERHGVADLVEVRYAPLTQVELDGRTFQWYASDGWSDLDAIELLFVDGPPGDLGPHARFPALPLLGDRLHPDGLVVLDDMIRTDEQEVLAAWLEAYPSYSAEQIRLEKNAALLRRDVPRM